MIFRSSRRGMCLILDRHIPCAACCNGRQHHPNYLSMPFALYLSLYLSVCLSIIIYHYLSCIFHYLSLSFIIHLSIHSSIHPSIHPSLSPSLSLSLAFKPSGLLYPFRWVSQPWLYLHSAAYPVTHCFIWFLCMFANVAGTRAWT